MSKKKRPIGESIEQYRCPTCRKIVQRVWWKEKFKPATYEEYTGQCCHPHQCFEEKKKQVSR